MKLLPLARGPVEHIAYNLRQADREELAATCWRLDSALLARTADACRLGFVAAADDGTPVAAFGATEAWPGVWQVGMFATARWPEVALAATRHARRVLMPAVRDTGAHRAHAFSLATHTEAHRWLEWLGASRETTLRGWGRGGEDFILFAWWR